MKFDTNKLHTLFNSVMEDKFNVEDEKKVKAYLNQVFGKGRPSLEGLHQFNEVVVRQADIIAQKKATSILDLLADVVRRPANETYVYTIPEKHNAKWVWSARGTSVEHVRLGDSNLRTITPTRISTGLYYELESLAQADVAYFQELVNLVADAKIQLYFEQISIAFQAAVANGNIPTNNILQGSNLTLRQYTEFVSRFTRGGGRPVFVADALLIDQFAFGATSDSIYQHLLYPELQRSLVEDLNITQIGRSTAVNLVNPYVVGSGNTETLLPVNEGYMFASGSLKPFKIVEFGELKQWTEFDSDVEQVQIKLTQDFGLDFIDTEQIGYVQDDALSL